MTRRPLSPETPNRPAAPRRAGPAGPLAALAAAGLLLAAPVGPAAAQEEPSPDPGARADSLARRVAELEARMDSLLRLVEQLRDRAGDTAAAGAADTADGLAELRAAAREAAREAAEADTADGDGGASGPRGLQALNPEISVTGDLVANWARPAEGSDVTAFTPREFEFSFQAALDPYTRTKIFLAREEEFEVAGLEEALSGARPDFLGEGEDGHGEGLDLEEGYLYWVGLPAGIGLKAGRFRQEIGRYNRWHTHALLEVDRPLASMHFLGEDGLIQTGVALTSPSVTTGAGTHELTVEATRGNHATLLDGGDDPSWLGHLNSFWDLGPDTYLELGTTAFLGTNDEVADGVDLDTRLLSFDAAVRWRPTGRGLYEDARLAAAWYLAEKDYGGVRLSGHGGYLQGNYRLDRRWVVGARADWLDGFGDAPRRFQLAPHVSWWQSEWVRLRLQYSYLDTIGGDADHSLLLQTVWSVGPHKHETY